MHLVGILNVRPLIWHANLTANNMQKINKTESTVTSLFYLYLGGLLADIFLIDHFVLLSSAPFIWPPKLKDAKFSGSTKWSLTSRKFRHFNFSWIFLMRNESCELKDSKFDNQQFLGPLTVEIITVFFVFVNS